MTGTKIRMMEQTDFPTEVVHCEKCKINFSSPKDKVASCPICKSKRLDGTNLLKPGNRLRCLSCFSTFPYNRENARKNVCPNKCDTKMDQYPQA